mmetsp:Transcript_20512/g.48232  ORF Transcript_20512/g.48232 Transcript_20512/m.48232 type:complete len:345 (-) Transcript_20512:219-1253(-)
MLSGRVTGRSRRRRRRSGVLLLRGGSEIEPPRHGRGFRGGGRFRIAGLSAARQGGPAVQRGAAATTTAGSVHHPHGRDVVDGRLPGVGNDHHPGDGRGDPRGLLLDSMPRERLRGGAGGRRNGLFVVVVAVVAPVFFPGRRGRHRRRRGFGLRSRRAPSAFGGRLGFRRRSGLLLLVGSGFLLGALHQKVPTPAGPSTPLQVPVGFHDGRIDVLFLATADDVLDVEPLDVGGLVVVVGGLVGVNPHDDGAPAGLVDVCPCSALDHHRLSYFPVHGNFAAVLRCRATGCCCCCCFCCCCCCCCHVSLPPYCIGVFYRFDSSKGRWRCVSLVAVVGVPPVAKEGGS